MTDIDGNLKEQVRYARTSSSRTFFLTFEPHGWARFVIDDALGALTIDSDWGSWSHVWGGGPKNWGTRTFSEFLRDRKAYDYLTDKLHYGGRTRELIDGKATAKRMRELVIQKRLGRVRYNYAHRRAMREPEIDKDRARELWKGIDQYVYEIEDNPMGDHVWEAVRKIEEEYYIDDFGAFFDDLYDRIETKPHPRLVFLRDQLLPVMVACLRGEIDAREEPVRIDVDVDVAAGQAGVASELPGYGTAADETVPGR